MKIKPLHIVALTGLIILAVLFFLWRRNKKIEMDKTLTYFRKHFPKKEADELADIFSKYFVWSEFDSPDLPGSGYDNMKPETMSALVLARQYTQIPFIINSAYRTAAHNAKVGGVPNSAHTKGYAVDVSTRGKDDKKMLDAFLRFGFKRIGVYNTFIHVDKDPNLPQNVAWNNFSSINQIQNYIA